MNDENRKSRKYWIFVLFALLIAFIAYAIADDALNQTIAINQTMINNSGGGGVSFNGGVQDLNGTRLDNGTFNGTMNHSNLTNLLWSKANHSIDTNVSFGGYGIDNLLYIENISSARTEVFYYVSKYGDDNNDCSVNMPCKTIQKAVDKIPAILNANHHIIIGDGIYLESVKIGGKAYSGTYNIYINGTRLNITSLIAKEGIGSGSQIESRIHTNVTSMTTNQYTGMFMVFDNTSLAGQKRIVNTNNGSDLNFTGDYLASNPVNALFTIYKNNVTFTRFKLEPNQVNVIFTNVNINNAGEFVSNPTANLLIQGQAQFYEAFFTDGTDMSLSDFYCNMCVMKGTVDFSGYQVRNSVFEAQASLIYSTCGKCSFNFSWGIIVKPGSYALLTSGTMVRNFTYGLYVSNSGTAQTWGKTTTYPFFKDNQIAFFAFGGGMISTTTGQRTFINNSANKVCDAASFSWCDT